MKKAEDDKLTKFVAGLLTMAEEQQKSMDRMTKDHALAYVKDIFATSDVVFGVWVDSGTPKRQVRSL